VESAAPATPGRDPIRPLLGAGLCLLLYRVGWFFLAPIGLYFGGLMVANTVPPLLASAVATAFAMAIYESRRLGDVGLHWREGSRTNLILGVAMGAAAACLVIVPPIALGFAHFRVLPHPDISWRGALFLPMLLFCGAMGEEIAFRGFTMQFLIRGYGAWIGVIAMGAFFGLLHAGNEGATPLSVFNTIGFGIVFGYAVLRSHDLWLPIGLHFGWNLTLPFLGADLSGITIRVTRYELVWKSGGAWSGGAYGPEASLLSLLVLPVLAAMIWKAPVRRGWAWLLDGAAPALDGESAPLPQSGPDS
jgi:membrane protease YdiL (CAAX protease family)